MKNRRKGFTLVEIILVLALIGIITTVSYSIFFTGEKSFETGINKGLEQEDFRMFREYLVKEFRNVSYLGNVKPDTEKYYTLKIDEENGVKQLKKIQYEDGKVIDSMLIPMKFDSIEIKVENEIVEVKIAPIINNENYNFTILLENDNTLKSPNLSKITDIIFYTYPENLKVNIMDWNNTTNYDKGDIVKYDGKKYKCTWSNKNNDKNDNNSNVNKKPSQFKNRWEEIE